MSEPALAPLPVEEALVVLEAYYTTIQEKFVSAGLTRCARTRLWCADWIHDTPRHFAACTDDGLNIYAAAELADLPDSTVLAILAHEFGHATDFLYPAEFARGRSGTERRDFQSVSDKQVRSWVSGWRRRDADSVEFAADHIAEYVLGIPIGYAGPCMLQCFNRGTARPAGLR